MDRIFRRHIIYTVGTGLLILTVAIHALTGEKFKLDEEILAWAEVRYGKDAQKRLLAWEKLIKEDNSASDMDMLEKVNRFFNKMEFVSDAVHWGQEDYWATPVEFLASNGGDCEDFSLAKYFTLKAMGIPEKKLNLTYVKALQINQAHMVMTYYEPPGN